MVYNDCIEKLIDSAVNFFQKILDTFLVYPNEVGPDIELPTLRIPGTTEENLSGWQCGHVAVNTIVAKYQTRGFRLFAKVVTSTLMAVHASGRKQADLFRFLYMNIMTRRTIH